MRADRRKKIRIIKNGLVQKTNGEMVNGWVDFKVNIFASKEPILGNEFFAALKTENKVDCKFRTSYFSGVTSEMRVVDEEGTYNIIGEPINVKSLNRELLLYCRRVENG
jgi:SPP1 family predicted phage head-tail adaptor